MGCRLRSVWVVVCSRLGVLVEGGWRWWWSENYCVMSVVVGLLKKGEWTLVR
jgi:hypothetical protein